MWQLNYTSKQLDLNSRYSAIKMFIIYSFYSTSDSPIIRPWVCDAVNVYLFTLYIAVVVSVFVGVQYEKTDISDEIIFFIFFKNFFFGVLTGIIIYLFFFFAGVFYVLKKFFLFFFYIVKGTFFFWRPIFKKFGYLLSFFKKKN